MRLRMVEVERVVEEDPPVRAIWAFVSRLQCPSRTVLEPPEPHIYVELCVDWFAKRTELWVGPPLIEPSTLPLFKAESTGPAPARPAAGTRMKT
jgi:hypothetical protein